jgi:hypothetical protein
VFISRGTHDILFDSIGWLVFTKYHQAADTP